FADIFYNNCVKNGILLVALKPDEVESLFQQVIQKPGEQVSADLEKQTVTDPAGKSYHFDINPFARTCLLKGLDHIGWTLQFADKIKAFEQRLKQEKPWLA
ncbi:MAG: 3-isopropylmalate dehydratase small subunit, partial [Candidatus Omnitrophica bacterium]|nr:3-isopropylmalate dehydratase small subunit [Candidatus Omnitrophota bacterium]